MTRTYCLVVNPAAGGGRARRLLPVVSGVLDAAGASYQVCESASLGHAKDLAAEAARRGEVVVAFGGDGMVGALAGTVAAAGGVFGIIPSGRGNDFARTLGIPLGPADAARILVDGRERPVDLIGVGRTDSDGPVTGGGAVAGGGPVTGGAVAGGGPEAGGSVTGGGAVTGGSVARGSPPGPGELVVAGSVYLGIPAIAAEIAGRSRVPPGEMAYPAAALRAVLGWRTATFRLELDGATGPADRTARPGSAELAEAQRPGAGRPGAGRPGGNRVREFSGGALVVANSRYFGAGMMVAPQADASDGLLDVVFIRGSSKVAMIRGLAKIKDGGHLAMSQVGTDRAAAVTVTAGRAVPGGADGESLACARPLEPGCPLRIRALPGVLRVIT